MNGIIKPTIGRRVWYWPSNHDLEYANRPVRVIDRAQPLDAGIIYVWGDRMVNLIVTDHEGKTHAITSVELWHGDCDRPNGRFCEWMPYQKAAAAPPPVTAAEQAAHDHAIDAALFMLPKGVSIPNALLRNTDTDDVAERAPILNAPFGFDIAIGLLKDGFKVTRTGWNGKGMWLELQRPDAHSKMTLPYVFLSYPKGATYPEGARVPWLASQTDLLAEDWEIRA